MKIKRMPKTIWTVESSVETIHFTSRREVRDYLRDFKKSHQGVSTTVYTRPVGSPTEASV